MWLIPHDFFPAAVFLYAQISSHPSFPGILAVHSAEYSDTTDSPVCVHNLGRREREGARTGERGESDSTATNEKMTHDKKDDNWIKWNAMRGADTWPVSHGQNGTNGQATVAG